MRRALALAVCLLLGLAGAELAIRAGDLFPEARGALLPGPEEQEPGREAPLGLVHPYQGWALRPRGPVEISYLDYLRRALPPGEPLRLADHGRNLFGFRSAIWDYREVAGDDFAIGVFGGSVAATVAALAGRELASELEARVPALAGRVRVLNCAAGGFKQPQQLAVLMQMRLLGVPLDAVVNLDGYNELVFAATNAADGVHPLFPSRFHSEALVRLAARAAPEALLEAQLGAVRARARARGLRRAAASPWLGWSALARAGLGAAAQRALRRAAALEAALHEADPTPAGEPLLASLPDPCLTRGDGCLGLAARLWRDASRGMAALARADGLLYLHALQPNAYVPGTKPLSAEERAVHRPDADWSRSARRGYPLLVAEGRALREQGVAFLDLTGLFRDEPDTVYVDDCCHMTAAANRHIARVLAAGIAEQL